MQASIIIVTRNRAKQLAQALKSLQCVRIPQGMKAEVMVVDNASTDETAKVVRASHFAGNPVRYTLESRKGQSYGRNCGLAQTTGELILFTDDDVCLPPDWLIGMCEPMVERKAGVVAGGVSLPPSLVRPWMCPLHRSWLASSEWLDPRSPGSLIGANMAFVRGVLRDVPSFDPELGPGAIGFGDETLFALQLQQAGHAICGRLQVQVEHHFDPDRLKRSAWLDLAARAGRTKAYVTYHWRHRGYRVPQTRLWVTKLRLVSWRRTHASQINGEGCAEAELRLVSAVGELSGFLEERCRPHNYTRKGLVKLTSAGQ